MAQQEHFDAQRALEKKKTCMFCGSEFSRHKGEGRKTFNARQTCGKNCTAELRKRLKQEEIVQDKKKCEICGEEFIRRPKSESRAKFQTRKTCSNTCGRRSRLEGHSWGVKERRPKKPQPQSSLKPVTPLAREIPDPPPAPPSAQPIWRPKAYGWPEDGPQVKVS